MGALAINQFIALSHKQRKNQIELDISLISNAKMLLSNEQLNLSREYNSRLMSKDITYYANGQYNQMTYSYLMGSGVATAATLWDDPKNIKSQMNMILTNAGGLVVMSDQYAKALKKVLGNDCCVNGKGGTFSTDAIPAIIAAVAGEPLTEENVREVINGKNLSSTWEGSSSIKNTKTLETTGTNESKDNSGTFTAQIESLVDFFYPIFQAAAANGWTAEYSREIKRNDNYISDALISGTLQLAQVQSDGNYSPDTSLSYFTMANIGGITSRQESSVREEITAWYNEQLEIINQKETMYDNEITELDAELQAINTEIESINSLLQDNLKEFNWCSNA